MGRSAGEKGAFVSGASSAGDTEDGNAKGSFADSIGEPEAPQGLERANDNRREKFRGATSLSQRRSPGNGPFFPRDENLRHNVASGRDTAGDNVVPRSSGSLRPEGHVEALREPRPRVQRVDCLRGRN